MRNHFFKSILLIALTLSMSSLAGYETIQVKDYETLARGQTDRVGSASKESVTDASIQLTVTRENGEVVQGHYVGNRFGSIDLAPKEVCHICLSLPGLGIDSLVSISSTHGGTIQGEHEIRLSVNTEGLICFDYEIGTLGEHPVNVVVAGRRVQLVFVASQVEAKKRAIQGGK